MRCSFVKKKRKTKTRKTKTAKSPNLRSRVKIGPRNLSKCGTVDFAVHIKRGVRDQQITDKDDIHPRAPTQLNGAVINEDPAVPSFPTPLPRRRPSFPTARPSPSPSIPFSEPLSNGPRLLLRSGTDEPNTAHPSYKPTGSPRKHAP